MAVAWLVGGLDVAVMTLLAHAALIDWRERRIRNTHCLAIAVLGLVVAALGQRLGGSALTGAVLLALGLLAWQTRLVGGGDVKLLAAVTLWAGPQNLLALLGATALTGGGLALAALWRMYQPDPVSEPQTALTSPSPPAGVPYGVAIAGGAAWVWLVTTFA